MAKVSGSSKRGALQREVSQEPRPAARLAGQCLQIKWVQLAVQKTPEKADDEAQLISGQEAKEKVR